MGSRKELMAVRSIEELSLLAGPYCIYFVADCGVRMDGTVAFASQGMVESSCPCKDGLDA